VESTGKAALGGHWSLVDSAGMPVTSGDLLGHYHLLYFGFTFCPDICPNEMVKMGRALELYGACCTRGVCAGLLTVAAAHCRCSERTRARAAERRLRAPAQPLALRPSPPCPLPLPLAHATAAKKSMPAGAPDVVPVFITLDPRRDSCAQVGAYVKDFHSRMVGE
jgi:cytochrome oxidase Cu insertion factor (SCO1/SenC/PrrC family)